MPDESRRIRVVYADDDAGYRTGLLRSLLGRPGIEVVAVAVDGKAALQAIEEHHPDVALVDLGTPGISGIDVAEQVAARRGLRPTRVLLLASAPVASTRRVLQAVGLRGVVDRASSKDDICAALTAAGA